MVTTIDPIVLFAALRRNGVWFVDARGNATHFYHRACYKHGVTQVPASPFPA